MEREIITSDSVPALCGETESRKRNEGMETPGRKMGNGKTEEGKNRIVRDLTSGNVARTMIWFAAPLFLSSLLQTTYNMADMIIIGHFVGKEGVAAASIGGDVLLFASFVAMGFANAGQVIISQLVGAGRHDKVNRLIGTMFTVLLCCAMLIGSLGLIFQETLLQWLNTPPEALEYTRAYTDVCLTGLVFIYGYNVVSAVLRGMGDSKHPFYFIALATGLNVVLDLVLVVGFRMAIFGVALATVISQAVSFCWAVTFLYRRKTAFGFDFKLRSFAVDREVLIPFLKLGIPMMIQGASIDFSKLFVNAWINSYGVLATAMTGIGNKVGSVVNVVNVALSTAGSSMIGQCIGAEKYERVPKVLKVSFSINIAISLAMGIVTVLFPSVVFGIFTGDAEVLKLSLRYIPVALLLFAGSALRPPHELPDQRKRKLQTQSRRGPSGRRIHANRTFGFARTRFRFRSLRILVWKCSGKFHAIRHRRSLLSLRTLENTQIPYPRRGPRQNSFLTSPPRLPLFRIPSYG